MPSTVVIKRRNPTTNNRNISDNKVFVGRHRALYQYCREKGYIGHETPAYFDRVSIAMIKNKDVVGMLPLEMACHTNSYTEIPLKCHVERNVELSIEDIRMGALPAHTYKIRLMK